MEVKPPMASGVTADFRAAAEHHVGVAVPDIVEGVAHGVGAAGAGGHRAGAHAPEAGVMAIWPAAMLQIPMGI